MPTIQKYQKDEGRKIQAYQHFINKGYSPEASAGIVGNLVYESGLNTSIEGDKGFKGGSSFGIAQFRGDRLKRLKSMYGDKWTDLNNQLDFVDWELKNTHKKAGDLLKTVSDVHKAGQIFSDYYEIPAKKYNENKDRASKVEQIYQTLVVTPNNIPTIKEDIIQDWTPVQKSTATVPNLPITTENVSFTAEISKLEKQAKDKELAFLQEYQNTLTTPEEQMAQEEVAVQLPQINATDIFNQVSQFIDSDFMQSGGVIRDNIPNPYPQIITNRQYTPTEQFTIDYISSPLYRQRLISQGYENPDQEIQIRLNNIKNVKTLTQDGSPNLIQQFGKKITNTPYSTVGSAYDAKTNTVIMDTKTDRVNTGSVPYNLVKAHELGHSEISDGTLTGSRLNDNDKKELLDRHREYDPEKMNGHDYKPEENKSDLNALRYLLKQEGIYDAGKEKFKREHLKKIPNNFVKQRLLKNYKEEDLIWLMNNIAMNEETASDTSLAQQGGIAEFLKPVLQPKKEARNAVRDGIENSQQVNLAEILKQQKDKEELSATGTIKNPRSLVYKKRQVQLTGIKQDNRTEQEREQAANISDNISNEQIGVLQRPLVYLANPLKIPGDIVSQFKPNRNPFPTSEEDRQAIMMNRYNTNQTRSEQFTNSLDQGLAYVPDASLNLAFGAVNLGERATIGNLVNQTVNPFSNIMNKQFIPNLRGNLPESLEILEKNNSVLLRGDGKTYGYLHLSKPINGEVYPENLRIDKRLWGNRIQDVLYDAAIKKTQAEGNIGVRSGEYLLSPDKTVKLQERFNSIDKGFKGKTGVDVKVLTSSKNPNIMEEFLQNYSRIPKKSENYSINDLIDKVRVQQQGGKIELKENEIAFLSDIAIKDNQGQRKYPNQITEIEGAIMSTEGYGNIPLYVVPDTGKPKVIYPNTGEHTFKGASKFIEIPIKK